MRVNPKFSSVEFNTIRELTMPSEITWPIACCSRYCTVIGRTSVKSAVLSPSSVIGRQNGFLQHRHGCGCNAQHPARPLADPAFKLRSPFLNMCMRVL